MNNFYNQEILRIMRPHLRHLLPDDTNQRTAAPQRGSRPHSIHELKKTHRPGTRVRLIAMNDPYPLPAGSIGIIQGIDAAGNILVRWNNGSRLSLIPEADQYELLN